MWIETHKMHDGDLDTLSVKSPPKKSPNMVMLEMLLSTVVLLALSAKATAFCCAPPPSEAFKAVHAACANANTSFGLEGRAAPDEVGFKPVAINTYVHVI